MQNYNTELEKLRAAEAAKLARKERELQIKCDLMAATGLEFSVLIHDWTNRETISVWIENNTYDRTPKFDRSKLEIYYDQISTLFKPAPNIFEASGRPTGNVAPVRIDVINNTGEIVFSHPTTLKIEFTFAGGINVAFKMPLRGNIDPNHLYNAGRVYKKYRRESKDVFAVAGFDRIRWSGDTYTTYTTDPERVPDLMRIAFTGKDSE